MSENTEQKEQVKFSFKSRKKIPVRKYKKGSKYDGLVESFLKQAEPLVEVTVEGRENDANYVRTQLQKRIEALDLVDKIKVTTANNVCYMQKITPEKK